MEYESVGPLGNVGRCEYRDPRDLIVNRYYTTYPVFLVFLQYLTFSITIRYTNWHEGFSFRGNHVGKAPVQPVGRSGSVLFW